jgi:oxygen-independent coproporphyrinogen-3 oxidase
MASLLAGDQVSSGSLSEGLGLYVHLPFCHSKCHFCDFAMVVGAENRIDAYLTALQREAVSRGGGKLTTLFIGGGTPTALLPEQIDRLFALLKTVYDFSALTEASVEANPESSSNEVLQAYRRNGINRISFGLQATQPALLKSLNRLHSCDDFLSAYRRARQMGFANINVDLMFGLPGQTRENWMETLGLVSDLKPEHISAYALKVEMGTRFKKDGVQADDDLEADLYLDATRFLTGRGFRHYEISNFCQPGFESRHNLRYWLNQPTVGLGVSAASYLDGTRSKNTSQLNRYLDEWSGRGSTVRESVLLPAEKQELETLMLGLRLDEGVSEEVVRGTHIAVFDQFLSRGLARVEQGRYRLTPEGWLLSNRLFQELI